MNISSITEETNCTEAFTDPVLAILCEGIQSNMAGIQSNIDTINDVFLLWAAAQVLSMHTGFAMLSVGAVRAKNARNILLSIVVDACVCAIAWWLVGYAFAFGTSNTRFIGATGFAGTGLGVDYPAAFWWFQFAFAATAATIVSGCVAERATFEAYMSYSFLLSALVYPVVAHWLWQSQGWLYINSPDGALFGVGAFDFAGCGPIHMVGGLAGAIGGKIIGPRIGRFDPETGKVMSIPGHNTPLAILGLFFLWIGWFSFNPGSVIFIAPSQGPQATRAAVNTVISSGSGALTSLFTRAAMRPGLEWDIGFALNGLLAGLVAITGCCSIVEPWAAFVIGILGGATYNFASWLTVEKLRIDDPLDATPVHFFCGMLGIIVTGFFANPEYLDAIALFSSNSPPTEAKKYAGIFYAGDGTLLACGIIEILAIIGWVSLFMTPYFLFLRKMGWLRVSQEAEMIGIDVSHHGGSAYGEFHIGKMGDSEREGLIAAERKRMADAQAAQAGGVELKNTEGTTAKTNNPSAANAAPAPSTANEEMTPA